MLVLVLSFLAGLVGHQTNVVFEQIESGATKPYWTRQGRSIVGILCGWIPFVLAMKEMSAEDPRPVSPLRGTAYYFAVWVFVGLGVQFGYLVDHYKKQD